MADFNVRGRRDDTIHPLRADLESGGNLALRRLPEYEVIDLRPYLSILRANLRRIALSVLLAIALTVLVTSVLMRKSYRAFAVLRPVPKAASAGRIAGLFGSMGAGSSPLAALMGAEGGPGADEAQEYMTILQSFAFNTSLIARHHLDGALFKPSSNPLIAMMEDKDPRWRSYKRMMKWFFCDYSIKTGNITLYFRAQTPAEAETILGFYVDDLREKLRSREVTSAAAAIDSMKAQARETPDALLQAQLYGLIATQMQELRLAQVEADFAFTVLEPPAAPDKPYSPNILLDSAIAGFLALVVSAMWVLLIPPGPDVSTKARSGKIEQ